MLIAIEGVDGSGKGTQAELLKSITSCSEIITFPQYNKTKFGTQVGKFLDGKFGSIGQVHPLLASLLFSGDRFEFFQTKFTSIDLNNRIIFFDRYVSSNIAHQAAKLSGKEMVDLIDFIYNVEYEIYKLPKPDVTIFLDMPIEHCVNLIAKKAQRNYTDKKADIHEADVEYLKRVQEVYRFMSREWITIKCVDGNNEILPVKEITRNIVRKLTDRFSDIELSIGTNISTYMDIRKLLDD